MQVIHIKINYSLIPKKLNHVMHHMKILHNPKKKWLTHNVFQRTNKFMT
jgi:hypothetical protein